MRVSTSKGSYRINITSSIKSAIFFPFRLIPGIQVNRYKRFLADVRLRNGRVVTTHCTDTGRMTGCSELGINTFHSNQLAIEGIETGIIEELQGYKKIWREVRVVTVTRLDLRLDNRGGPCFVEVRTLLWSMERWRPSRMQSASAGPSTRRRLSG